MSDEPKKPRIQLNTNDNGVCGLWLVGSLILLAIGAGGCIVHEIRQLFGG